MRMKVWISVRPHQENEDGTSNNDGTATTNARSLVHNHAELLEAHPLWVRLPLQRTEHDDINTKDDQHQHLSRSLLVFGRL